MALSSGSDDRTRTVVHVEVIDDGSAVSLPFVRAATPDGDGGRGLLMVELLSARWGVHHDDETGNAVWFHLPDSTTNHDQ
ncbi:ATP-binding protein [Streptosporangium sp. NPDC051023]|uniref:ATP-binding protein n=1 Tax=Streptosporangium sp. NPDC051023 TaxID=3155410 RepID=UPI0034510E96